MKVVRCKLFHIFITTIGIVGNTNIDNACFWQDEQKKEKIEEAYQTTRLKERPNKKFIKIIKTQCNYMEEIGFLSKNNW